MRLRNMHAVEDADTVVGFVNWSETARECNSGQSKWLVPSMVSTSERKSVKRWRDVGGDNLPLLDRNVVALSCNATRQAGSRPAPLGSRAHRDMPSRSFRLPQSGQEAGTWIDRLANFYVAVTRKGDVIELLTPVVSQDQRAAIMGRFPPERVGIPDTSALSWNQLLCSSRRDLSRRPRAF